MVWACVVEVNYIVPDFFEFLIVGFSGHFNSTTAQATEGRYRIVFSLPMTIPKLGPLFFAPISHLCISIYVYDDTFDEHLLFFLLLFLVISVDWEIWFDHLKSFLSFMKKAK